MSSTPAAPLFAFTRRYASQTVCLEISNGFVLSNSSSLSVDSQIKLNNAAPLLHSHYGNFIAPTDCSVPVLRIGTLILGDLPLGFLPWHRSDRFPCSIQKPAIRSRHLYAGHHSGSRQVSPELITGQCCNPVFDAVVHGFDTSSMIRLRSPSCCAPDPVIARPFP